MEKQTSGEERHCPVGRTPDHLGGYSLLLRCRLHANFLERTVWAGKIQTVECRNEHKLSQAFRVNPSGAESCAWGVT